MPVQRPRALDAILRRDRSIVAASLALLAALSWVYLVAAAHDMSLMGMPEHGHQSSGGMESGGGMPMSTAMTWTPLTFALMVVMWAVMMVGMMIPSAAPMILLYAQVVRKNHPESNPLPRTAAFTSGYLVVWTAFSVTATLLQLAIGTAELLSPMLATASVAFGAALFATAGLYQLTPLKRACLRHCRSPVHFLATHWRPGVGGALRIGLAHGIYCVGCCAFLMVLLFVGGVMNLLWVAAIAAIVLLEKLAPGGDRWSKAAGLALLGTGALLLLAPQG